MNFEETQQDGQHSRALLGIALVVVLLVAAGALFFVWRPEAYQGAVAALTSSPKDTSEPLVSAVQHAKVWLSQALHASERLSVGRGRGPVHHFHAWW